MSTPTPAPSAGKYPSYASHAVSTPHNLAPTSTPTPRSVPSPAIARSNGGKTPAGAAMTSSPHPTAGIKGSTPSGGVTMAPSLSQMSAGSAGSMGNTLGGLGIGGLGNSLAMTPAMNNLLGFASPAALAGLSDMGTPSLLDVGGGVSGGHAMNLTLSDLGLSSGRRDEDQERRGKMQAVLGRLQGGRWGTGRVSEEGVRRAGKWAGFDIEVEAKWDASEFEGERPVIIAGRNAVLVDVTFKDNVPRKLDVSFSSADEAVQAHRADAAKVLFDDLTPARGMNTINTRLDRFATNLEAIARLDKLSSGGLDCFEAVTGVYASLKRLYKHEREAARVLMDEKRASQAFALDREVMCKRSGRPGMHVGGRLGLSMDYWMQQRLVRPERPDVDVDLKDHPGLSPDTDHAIFTLDITAEPTDPALYPSLRISSDWLSPQVVKSAEDTTDPSDLMAGTQSIDWLEPAQTLLSTNDNTVSAMVLDNSSSMAPEQKLPDVRFVAHLRPPIVMPWNVAGQILQSVGATSMPSAEGDQLSTYEAMLLGGTLQTGGAMMVCRQSVQTGSQAKGNENGQESEGAEEVHVNALYVPTQEYACRLQHIPFSHPRQLVQILPMLRQWASCGELVRDAFDPASDLGLSDLPQHGQGEDRPTGNGYDYMGAKSEVSLSDLLGAQPPLPQTSHAQRKDDVPVEITLSTSPIPSLSLIFPLSSNKLAQVTAAILPNAEIMITAQENVVAEDQNADSLVGDVDGHAEEGSEKQDDQTMTGMDGLRSDVVLNGARVKAEGDLSKALDVCADLGVWVEWMRSKHGRT